MVQGIFILAISISFLAQSIAYLAYKKKWLGLVGFLNYFAVSLIMGKSKGKIYRETFLNKMNQDYYAVSLLFIGVFGIIIGIIIISAEI